MAYGAGAQCAPFPPAAGIEGRSCSLTTTCLAQLARLGFITSSNTLGTCHFLSAWPGRAACITSQGPQTRCQLSSARKCTKFSRLSTHDNQFRWTSVSHSKEREMKTKYAGCAIPCSVVLAVSMFDSVTFESKARA